MTILIAIVVISIIIILIAAYYGYRSNEQSKYENSGDNTYTLHDSVEKKHNATNAQNDYSINNSYAFANRLKNLIFSRGVDEAKLIADLGITENDLKVYKYSKGLPPFSVLNAFAKYFNVSFRYLADLKGDTITVYRDGNILYSTKYNYPHKARFDNVGNCIFLDRTIDNKSEIMYHLDTNGNVLGFIKDFTKSPIEYIKLSDNGLNVLLVAENKKIFFVDLTTYTVLWSKYLKLHNYNIKDITDTELVFRFRYTVPPVDFSLDYSGEPFNFNELSKCFVENLPPVRYHADGYILVVTELLKDFDKNEDAVITLFKRMTTSGGIKYFSTGKLAKISKSIAVSYFEAGDYKNAEVYFNKALTYNSKIGVKSYINKIEKLKA